MSQMLLANISAKFPKETEEYPECGRSGSCRKIMGSNDSSKRAQVLYYIAENLAIRSEEFAENYGNDQSISGIC
jgi:hypothetical protein